MQYATCYESHDGSKYYVEHQGIVVDFVAVKQQGC